MELLDLCSLFSHWIAIVRLSSRVSTGSTGKATSTPSSLQRWRLGHPTLEIWKDEGNVHKNRHSSTRLPRFHISLRPKAAATRSSAEINLDSVTFLQLAGKSVETNVFVQNYTQTQPTNFLFKPPKRETISQSDRILVFPCSSMSRVVRVQTSHYVIILICRYDVSYPAFVKVWAIFANIQCSFLWLLTFYSL